MTAPSEKAWRIWNALFTGIHFALFKFLAGAYLCLPGHGPALAGAILMGLGAVDVLLNLGACFLPRPFPVCFLSLLGSKLEGKRNVRGSELGLGLDTLLAFTIVSLMIWNHCLAEIAPTFGRTWDVAVICNVLGAGLARVAEALSESSPSRPAN